MRPIRWGKPRFEAGGQLYDGPSDVCVDHDPVGLSRLGGEGLEDLVRHPEQAPSYEETIKALNRSVVLGGKQLRG
jgi:hypothetical protein